MQLYIGIENIYLGIQFHTDTSLKVKGLESTMQTNQTIGTCIQVTEYTFKVRSQQIQVGTICLDTQIQCFQFRRHITSHTSG